MSTDPESRGGFGPYLRAVGPEYEDNGAVKTIRYGEISDLARALELHGKNTAAFLVEPIQGEAGYVHIAPASHPSDCTLSTLAASLCHPRATSHRRRSCARSTTFCLSAMRSRP